jgi:hypothetical protein
MADHKLEHKGLSPSSLQLFMGCNRRYFYKKIAKVPIDGDAPEDQESFEVGKAFHKVLENTKHSLTGISYDQVRETVSEFKVENVDQAAPLIFAMLKSYDDMHKKSGLEVVACELPIETDTFYGITDVILQDGDGWYIGDMKTAASFSQNLIPTLPRHPQLNLYVAHRHFIAEKLGLNVEKFQGCRYRLTTKSKIGRKDGEVLEKYINRLSGVVRSYDFFIPKALLDPEELRQMHAKVWDYIEKNRHELDASKFPQNPGGCMSYFKPCEFWSKCHKRQFTDELKITAIVSGES